VPEAFDRDGGSEACWLCDHSTGERCHVHESRQGDSEPGAVVLPVDERPVTSRADPSETKIHLLFSRELDGWRLDARGWIAPAMRQRLNPNRFPVREPDLADLERFMWKASAPYLLKRTATGGVLIEAEDRSAVMVCEWLKEHLDVAPIFGARRY
jgi:hypothetical protein